MLKDQDRIFKNLYNDLGEDVSSAQKRGDWIDTKEICHKGREWIINEIKIVLYLHLYEPRDVFLVHIWY